MKPLGTKYVQTASNGLPKGKNRKRLFLKQLFSRLDFFIIFHLNIDIHFKLSLLFTNVLLIYRHKISDFQFLEV